MMFAPPAQLVILNLFQDPFLPLRRSLVGKRNGAVALLNATPERAARWVLKQVQHDEFLGGSVVA
jgi:hypothetical protein